MVELCFGGLVGLGGVRGGHQHLRIDTCLDDGRMGLDIMQDTLWGRKGQKVTRKRSAQARSFRDGKRIDSGVTVSRLMRCRWPVLPCTVQLRYNFLIR